jgi:hypothetical protein
MENYNQKKEILLEILKFIERRLSIKLNSNPILIYVIDGNNFKIENIWFIHDEFRRLFNYDYYRERLNDIIEKNLIYDLNVLQRYLREMVDVSLIKDFYDYENTTRCCIQMCGNIKRLFTDQFKSLHIEYFADNNDPPVCIGPVSINLSIKFETPLKFL